jgi:ribosomal protein L30/L7E
MKKAILFCGLILAVTLHSNTASAQIFKKIISAAKGDKATTTTSSSTTTAAGTPSNLEISTALKQALEQGTGKSSDQLSALDGFFGNAAVKILFPPEAQKAEKTLRSLGLDKLCDDVILSLNRAAEGAAKEAKPIFIDAIKQMTLQDVTNILLGNPDAATQYFKRTTTLQLSAKFKPVIQLSLDKAGATKYYTSAATTFNKVPLVKKINPDISDYVTQKAIDGLFFEIAQEELNIRKNLPSTRTTEVMQKVFSFADKMKK